MWSDWSRRPGTSGMQRSEAEQILEEAFNLFDHDGSGTICTSEFGMVMRAIGFNPTDAEVHEIVKKLDKNDSGRLEFNEFRDFYRNYKDKHKNSEEAIEKAFKLFDKNGDGFIQASEIKTILSKCGQSIDDDQVREMIDVADVDKDGQINYKEFVKFICKPLKP